MSSSNQTTIVDVEKVEINPLNPPAFQSYSFRQGFPIVQFLIASQDKMLVGSSLRLNGTLRLNKDTSTEAVPALVDNDNRKGGGAYNAAINSRVGVSACINQITLSSQTNQTLEVVRQYGRYIASAQSITHSAEDLDTCVAQQSLTASRGNLGAVGMNEDVGFSVPLRTGLLSGGNPIPLGQNGVRGLIVQLELAPDSNVLGPWYSYDDAGVATKENDAGTGTGAFYQLRDLTLSYDLLVPDADGVAQMGTAASGSMTYNAVSHLYSVINSSDQTQNLNLGTSKTLSVFHNFLPTTHINNYNEDGFTTPSLRNANGGAYDQDAEVKEVSFSKGGILFPIENMVDVEFPSRTNEDRPLAELETNFINAIKPYKLMNHSVISLNTQNKLSTDLNVEGGDAYAGTQADPAEVFGIGVSTDPYKVGVDYSQTNYSLRIKSELDGQSPNSVFSYVLAQNTLQYSPQGIMISS